VPSVVWTIVVAAGAGQRFGRPKQFEMLGDRRVVDWSVDVARAASVGVVVVMPPGHGGVEGGATRSESVRNGLACIPDGADIVCVHDAARPFASSSLFTRVISAVEQGADAAVPALPVADTIKEIDASGVVVRTPERDRLVAVQTPQAFRAATLRAAHEHGGDATDDACLVEAIGGRVVVVEGDPENRKLTVPDDLEWARGRVAS
jgi:2-C-methyl-D-erythritol 4-phosphate cytidylyltransferase